MKQEDFMLDTNLGYTGISCHKQTKVAPSLGDSYNYIALLILD